jgi:integrase
MAILDFIRQRKSFFKMPDQLATLCCLISHGRTLLSSEIAAAYAWADFADSIDMPDVTFHALRHTHASQLIDEGVDIVTISKRLGHAKPDITLRIYAHLFRNDDSKAAAAIDAALARMVAKR